jgi:hypothetical protein
MLEKVCLMVGEASDEWKMEATVLGIKLLDIPQHPTAQQEREQGMLQS